MVCKKTSGTLPSIMVEGFISIAINNQLCYKILLLDFRAEQSRLKRLFSGLDTYITRYISEKQLLAILKMINIGKKILPLLYDNELIGQLLVEEFNEESTMIMQLARSRIRSGHVWFEIDHYFRHI